MAPVRDFPLFPLSLVALPSELIPLHIFEERYKTMIGRCLEEEAEFGIVWLSEDGLRPIGCACEIAEVTRIDRPMIYGVTRAGIERGELEPVDLGGGRKGFKLADPGTAGRDAGRSLDEGTAGIDDPDVPAPVGG